MIPALGAGAAYFAVVFAIAFGLGVARVLLLAPLVGDVAAVLTETPLILAASWLACGWLVRAWRLDGTSAPRIVMGATAFALLMAAELALSVLAFGRSPAEHVAAMTSPAGSIGLAAQLAFASLPWLRRRA